MEAEDTAWLGVLVWSGQLGKPSAELREVAGPRLLPTGARQTVKRRTPSFVTLAAR
ncbi:hypothetical protein [Streptomyces sp. NPDC051994]|uniref:hypothetical protein n=1 Tax=unclassified Streptomyces TaxID=2593676 RepID=UPI003441CFF5